jgi:hypothetical protein
MKKNDYPAHLSKDEMDVILRVETNLLSNEREIFLNIIDILPFKEINRIIYALKIIRKGAK